MYASRRVNATIDEDTGELIADADGYSIPVYGGKTPEITGNVAFDDLPLIVTVEQLDTAFEMGDHILVEIPCVDFLTITTKDIHHVMEIMDESPDNPGVFNVLAMMGEVDHLPALDISIKYKGVVGHQGRHRAASTIKAVEIARARMYVSIALFDPTDSQYVKYGAGAAAEGLTIEDVLSYRDIPKTVTSEMSVDKVNTNRWKPVARNREEMIMLLETVKGNI